MALNLKPDSGDLDEPAEKRQKVDESDDEACYYVYIFNNSEGKDLYFGHETVKSTQCREWAALSPSEREDKPGVSSTSFNSSQSGV
jgi:hypothetical protein